MEKGTYALVLKLERETTIAVGKLGRRGGRGGENEITFPAGYYIYVGSARGGLYPRVSRHLREGKRLRWHIDYLLEHAKVAEVWWTEDSQECLWACAAKGMPHARILVPGFGSSDCRCPAHLIYFPSLPSFELFQKALGEKGVQLKRTNPGEFLNP